MNEVMMIILAFVAGIALGFLFFGGLWLTVRIGTDSKIPALWFLGSLALRVTIVCAGFYYIGVGNLFQLLICFSGFFIARFIVFRLTKAYDLKHTKGEASHGA